MTIRSYALLCKDFRCTEAGSICPAAGSAAVPGELPPKDRPEPDGTPVDATWRTGAAGGLRAGGSPPKPSPPAHRSRSPGSGRARGRRRPAPVEALPGGEHTAAASHRSGVQGVRGLADRALCAAAFRFMCRGVGMRGVCVPAVPVRAGGSHPGAWAGRRRPALFRCRRSYRCAASSPLRPPGRTRPECELPVPVAEQSRTSPGDPAHACGEPRARARAYVGAGAARRDEHRCRRLGRSYAPGSGGPTRAVRPDRRSVRRLGCVLLAHGRRESGVHHEPGARRERVRNARRRSPRTAPRSSP